MSKIIKVILTICEWLKLDVSKCIKIYISGKISGLPLDQARQNFENAENKLCDEVYFHCQIINPMKSVPFKEGKSWWYYMRKDLKLLWGCDVIYVQKNWKTSKGAIIEIIFSILTFKVIMFEK